MNAQGFFITGTDTGVGKTRVTLALMSGLQALGNTVLGMKPVASGCTNTGAGLNNDDALQISKQSSSVQPYSRINPCAYEPPIAPHIAAEIAGNPIDLNAIHGAFQQLVTSSDRVIVEGIGGWRVPLGPGLSLVDLVKCLNIPVILVVGLRLGCINHALLTAESVRSDGVDLFGWAASQIDPEYTNVEQTLAALNSRIQAPFIGCLKYSRDADPVNDSKALNVSLLL